MKRKAGLSFSLVMRRRTSTFNVEEEDEIIDTKEDRCALLPYVEDADADKVVMKLAASENGGVALGAGSTLEANAVSVGSDEVKRRITQVADGVNATDAATLGQLQQLQTTFDPQATELESQLAELLSRIDALSTRLDDLQ
jgi:autotransporter adhesin